MLALLLLIKFFQDGAQINFTMVTRKDVVFDDFPIWVGLGFFIFSQVVLIISEIQIFFPKVSNIGSVAIYGQKYGIRVL